MTDASQPTERVCGLCGQSYAAAKSWQKWCSTVCRMEAARRNRLAGELERMARELRVE